MEEKQDRQVADWMSFYAPNMETVHITAEMDTNRGHDMPHVWEDNVYLLFSWGDFSTLHLPFKIQAGTEPEKDGPTDIQIHFNGYHACGRLIAELKGVIAKLESLQEVLREEHLEIEKDAERP